MPRNAAELRAAATATGLFNGPRRQYAGDGYSIPWDYLGAAFLPAGFTAYEYKIYLDNRWLEYSRLHDWLYTPYGGIISATQQEADDALYEELATQSLPDAFIVANACRAGGFLYYGKSTVGYFGENGSIGGPNIGLAPQSVLNQGVAGMSTKIVILFQLTTKKNRTAPVLNYDPAPRTGGWSESFYGPDDIATCISLLKTTSPTRPFSLLQARANLLANEANIVGARLYPTGSGRGQPLGVSIAGNNGKCDSPDNAIMCLATSTITGQSRRFTLRGMPDDDKTQGEWDPDSDDTGRVQQYFAALSGFGWQAQVETGKIKLFSNTGAGVFTAAETVPYAITNIITLKNVYLTEDERRIGGKYTVSALPGVNKFTVDSWNAQPGRGGTASLVQAGFQAFATSNLSVVRSVSRKVGRPFAGYRGRKSRRRKVLV